jgi:predicted house-cleaning noncanonical NTP pyrophosphatase (MazG superfamily)
MTRKVYNKLVRDRIPEIIEAAGQQCAVDIMADNEVRQALLTKLVEEAQEVLEATPEGLTTEIADLCEVLDAVIAAFDLGRESIQALQQKRQDERGGFGKRIKLRWVE